MGRQGKKSSFFVILLKQALEIKKTALPWNRAISAGLCLGLPSLIGYLMGNLPYGLLAGIGAFTYLYVGNEPYALRARKLFYTALGMSFSFVLGSLLAAYPVLSAFVLGMIGAVATFIFGALQFKGPAALFFVLNFALASGKTISPSQVLIEGTLVFLGGMLAWSIAMLGWLVNPHGPEIQTVRQLYKDLADLLKTAGSDNYSKSRHNILISMYAAEEAFAAKGFSTKENKRSRWLLQLFTLAHDIFQETDKWVLRGEGPLNPELAQVVGHVAKSITPHSKYQGLDLKGAVLHQEQQNLLHLVKQIEGVLQSSDRISVDDRSVTSVSVKNIFMGAMDKNSVVFLLSVRFGIILTIAALTAHAFNLNRSYWVPLSCAAVMLGSTVIATFHRAIQRSLGTIIGILVASAILWTRPEGFIVSIAIMLFTFFAELFIVRNYAIALLFVTPNALLMAETNTHIHNVAYFAGTRIMDVIVGSVIGLMGVLLIGRRSASSRVPYLMGRTLRSQSELLAILFTAQPKGIALSDSQEQHAMKTNLSNLTTVYQTAMGEIPRNEEDLERWLPVIWAIDQFGYLLYSYTKVANRPELTDQELSKVLLIFEKMAQSADQQRNVLVYDIPSLILLPKVSQELWSLQNTLENSIVLNSQH